MAPPELDPESLRLNFWSPWTSVIHAQWRPYFYQTFVVALLCLQKIARSAPGIVKQIDQTIK